MSRQDDLERSIAQAYDLIHEYQVLLRESESPKAKARARREIAEQRALIEGYRAELDAWVAAARPGPVSERGTPAAPLPALPRPWPLWMWIVGSVLALVGLVGLFQVIQGKGCRGAPR